MPQPNTIEKKKQLLVEGNDQRNFFEAFIKRLNRQDVQIQNFGGVNELRGFLRGFIKVPEWKSELSATRKPMPTVRFKAS